MKYEISGFPQIGWTHKINDTKYTIPHSKQPNTVFTFVITLETLAVRTTGGSSGGGGC